MIPLSADHRRQPGEGREEPHAAREWTAVAGVMLAVAIGMTWPLARHLGDALPADLADPLLNAFTMAWDAERMAHGLRGLWDAPFFFPLRGTLAFSDHLVGIALFTAPVQWLTGNAVLAYNLAFIASYALAGLGAYGLARSLWGSRWAAIAAGVAFAAAPHRAMHVSHLQILMSGWLPVSLWGLHEYFRSGSRRALAVSAGSYLLLALSSAYLMYFGLVPIAIVLAAGVFERVRHPGRPAIPRHRWGLRALMEFGVAGAVVSAILTPVALAYLRMRSTTGLRRSFAEMAMFSARLSDYVRIPNGLWAWEHVLPAGQPERMLFPGLLAVLLAGVALLLAAHDVARRPAARRDAWLAGLYGLVAMASIWLACGPSAGAYRWLVGFVPGFDGLRVPARFVVIAAMAVALLAGRGAAWVRVRAGSSAAALLVAGIAIEGFAGPLPLAPIDARQRDRAPLNAWLAAAPAGGVLELPVAGPVFQPFTMVYQFNTLFHRQPLVNGYSGTGHGLQDFLAGSASPLDRLVEMPAALQGLRAIGVRYLVVHVGLYERTTESSARPLVDAVDTEAGQLASRAQFGDTIAWRLADSLPGPRFARSADGTAIPAAEFTASASASPADAALAFDGTTATRWTTSAPKRGDEWFELTFRRERELAAVVFRTGRYGYSERPLRLLIESADDRGATRVLFEGSIVPATMVGLVGWTNGAVIGLPANATRVLRLRQTGRGGTLPWSIDELEILERR